VLLLLLRHAARSKALVEVSDTEREADAAVAAVRVKRFNSADDLLAELDKH